MNTHVSKCKNDKIKEREKSFPQVLNVIREPFLGPPHSHILYHTPTSRSDVTLAHIILSMPLRDTGSCRLRRTVQATFAMESEKSVSAGPIWGIGKVLMVGESRT
jgi:hypothetical protein